MIKPLDEFIKHEKLKGYKKETIGTKRKNILRFLEYFNHEYSRIEKDDILEYIDHLNSTGISEKKINLHITHLRQFYNFLIGIDEVLFNPLSRIPMKKTKRDSNSGIFTEDEIKGILRASLTFRRRKNRSIMIRDRAIIELFYSSGLRLHELAELDLNDIDLENSEISVYNAKGDTQRIVPVGYEALNFIKAYLKPRESLLKPGMECEALFISRQGNRLAEVSIRGMIHRRKAEANIKSRGTTHAFRRSCASHMLKNGAPLYTIREILGHESIVTTERYTDVYDIDLREKHRNSHPRG